MKTGLSACLIVVAAALVLPWSLQVHHGWAEFDSSQEITLNGSVTDFHFVNPHCVVEFDAKDSKGQVRRWQGEFSSPGPMTRKGWTAASLQPGDTFTATGNPAKSGVPAIHVLRIRLANGQEISVDSAR